MLKSMTGFAKISRNIKGYGHMHVEFRSLNGRSLSINLKTPNEIIQMDEMIRKTVKAKIKRGSITIAISVDYAPEFLNRLMKGRISMMKQLMKEYGDQSIAQLLVSDFANYVPLNNNITDKNINEILNAVGELINSAEVFRKREGQDIEKEMKTQLKRIEVNLNAVEKRAGNSVEKKKRKLAEIIGKIDDNAREQLVLYAEKVDINEEIQRMKSHIGKFSRSSSGLEMTFILQEMFRETNTMGAKSEDIKIIDRVLKNKEIIEQMKEQALNVE